MNIKSNPKVNFCIIDKESLNLFWPKYTNDEYRWKKYRPHLIEEISFKDWFNLYQGGFKDKFIPENIINNFTDHIMNPKYSSSERKAILCRTACLGNFLIDKFNTKNYVLFNHQKNRVDYILELNKNKIFKAKSSSIIPFLSRPEPDMINLFSQLESDFFSYDHVECIILDSFSELTDQLFISR